MMSHLLCLFFQPETAKRELQFLHMPESECTFTQQLEHKFKRCLEITHLMCLGLSFFKVYMKERHSQKSLT